MKAVVFVIIVAAVGVCGVAAQRTVTNADLDKYRIQREAAERDYRENYAKMGFPSPEELQRQLEQSRLENERLMERWSQERIELERAEAMRQQAQPSTTVVTIPAPESNESYQYGGNGYFGYGQYNPWWNGNFGNRYWRRGYRGPLPTGGYVSGGILWPGSVIGPRIRQR